jgi:hypothetical protein
VFYFLFACLQGNSLWAASVRGGRAVELEHDLLFILASNGLIELPQRRVIFFR